MKIGVDAGMLGVTDDRLKAGVWRVVHNILQALSEIDQKNIYYLYSFHPINHDFGPNFINRILRPTFGWMSFRVPLELAIHPIDVFLGFGQSLPYTSTKSIGCIYDLGFLHNPAFYPDSAKRLKNQTESVIKRADILVTISQTIQKEIQKTYGRMSHVLPLGVSLPKNSTPFTGANPYFLHVGALKRSKNIPAILRGFEEFLNISNKPYDLYLVGSDYWMDPEITRKNERIKIINWVSDEMLASYYRGASAFIALSLSEGFCLPVAEAMSFGLPVIVTDSHIMHETTGEQGIFVNPHNAMSVAKALLAHKDKKVVYNTSYAWQKSASLLLDLLRYV